MFSALFRSALFLLISLAPVTSVRAELFYSSFQAGDGAKILVVSGAFGPNEPLDAFTSALAANKASMVTFDSPGGNIYSAMALGRIIRLMGLITVQIRQLDCASACALAFIGGTERYAEAGAIGVHRASFAPDSGLDREEAVASVQAVTADVLEYLNEMGVSSDFLNFALRYDKSDIRYLSASEMQQLRVTTKLAPTPVDPPAPDTTVASARPQEEVARDLVRSLIEQDGMGNGAALRIVAGVYANKVSYYGKETSLVDVLADKQRYFQRWPERSYRIRGDSVLSTCAGGMCMVSGIYDWTVRSIPRHKQARGVARFNYVISVGDVPKVISEDGKVIK